MTIFGAEDATYESAMTAGGCVLLPAETAASAPIEAIHRYAEEEMEEEEEKRDGRLSCTSLKARVASEGSAAAEGFIAAAPRATCFGH